MKNGQKRQIRQREEEREDWELAILRITRLFYNHGARAEGRGQQPPDRAPNTAALTSALAWRYLVGVDLAFLAETRRHILGLDLLLGHVVLVLEMLVLHLSHRQR